MDNSTSLWKHVTLHYYSLLSQKNFTVSNTNQIHLSNTFNNQSNNISINNTTSEIHFMKCEMKFTPSSPKCHSLLRNYVKNLEQRLSCNSFKDTYHHQTTQATLSSSHGHMIATTAVRMRVQHSVLFNMH